MIDPEKVALFIPGGLKKFKLDLFERIGKKIGRVVRDDIEKLNELPHHIIPIIGCTPGLLPFVRKWREKKRDFIYWDRGYARRVFATWLPRGQDGGYYRWHLNSFQMQNIKLNISDDRWRALNTQLTPWQKGGRHIVIAHPTPTYARFHELKNWTERMIERLSLLTTRQLVVRDKETKRPLKDDLVGAHALVAHASNAAVEAAIMGCPVFVDQESAAALVGLTNIDRIEYPIYPDREQWANSLAYNQFNEKELVDGTLWRLIN